MKRILSVSALLTLVAALAAAAPPPVAEMLKLVPEGAQSVVAVDTAALRSHPMVQSWLLEHHAWSGADRDLPGFLAEAGLDPVRDVDGIVAVLLGEPHAHRGLVLCSGRYDPAALGAALVKRGATAFTIGATTAYRLPDSEHHGHDSAVLAAPSADLVVVGEETAVTAALGAPHAIPPLVAEEASARHIDLRAPFWAVTNVPAEAREKVARAGDHVSGEGSDTVRGVLLASGTVERIAIQAFLDDSVRISGVAVADTAENAQLLRDAAKGAVAAARLATQNHSPELVDVLRGVVVAANGNEVSVAANVPVALLEKLAAEHKAHATEKHHI